MIIDYIIQLLHIIFILYLLLSIFINNNDIKLYSLLLIIFILLHYLTKYGKCSIISIERFFLGDNFRNGFFYKLIKPIISYKNNEFYNNGGIYVLLFYIIILIIQLRKKLFYRITQKISLFNNK